MRTILTLDETPNLNFELTLKLSWLSRVLAWKYLERVERIQLKTILKRIKNKNIFKNVKKCGKTCRKMF